MSGLFLRALYFHDPPHGVYVLAGELLAGVVLSKPYPPLLAQGQGARNWLGTQAGVPVGRSVSESVP